MKTMIAAGILLALTQVFTADPYLPLLYGGLLLAFLAGIRMTDRA